MCSQKWNSAASLFPKQNHNVFQFMHPYICERFIYFQDRSAYPTAGKYVDQSWEYINRPQTHECGNWYWDRAIPRKGIHKWDFHCSVSNGTVPSKISECPVPVELLHPGQRALPVELQLSWDHLTAPVLPSVRKTWCFFFLQSFLNQYRV